MRRPSARTRAARRSREAARRASVPPTQPKPTRQSHASAEPPRQRKFLAPDRQRSWRSAGRAAAAAGRRAGAAAAASHGSCCSPGPRATRRRRCSGTTPSRPRSGSGAARSSPSSGQPWSETLQKRFTTAREPDRTQVRERGRDAALLCASTAGMPATDAFASGADPRGRAAGRALPRPFCQRLTPLGVVLQRGPARLGSTPLCTRRAATRWIPPTCGRSSS